MDTREIRRHEEQAGEEQASPKLKKMEFKKKLKKETIYLSYHMSH